MICIWCHGKFRVNNKNFEKHIMHCEHRIVYKPSDFWSRITIPKTRGLLQFNTRNSVKAKFVIYSDFELYCNKDEEDVMSHFCIDLQNMYETAFNYFEQYKEVPKLIAEQQEEFNKADKRARCKKSFTNNNPKCRHHDDTTGEYIGP
jgi:hypothetical protein